MKRGLARKHGEPPPVDKELKDRSSVCRSCRHWRSEYALLPEMAVHIALNSQLSPNLLHARYAEHKRLQIRDILLETSAEAIHAEMSRMPWWLAFNEGTLVHQLTPKQLSALRPDEVRDIQLKVYQGAVNGYQFLYNYYPLFAEYFERGRNTVPLAAAFEFVNSKPFLDFVRAITGLEGIRWADAHATLYRAGHFLKFHTDENPREQRLAAYVLNFTKSWGRDWGGLLQFWDKKYDVELAYRPIFNALNIFTVPSDHSVSVVAPYAPGLRFSLTGWLRGDEPPGPIG